MPGYRGFGMLIALLVLLVTGRAADGAGAVSSSAPRDYTPLPQPTPTPLPGGCPPLLYEGFESGTLGAFDSSGNPGWWPYDYYSWAGRFNAYTYYMSSPPPPPPQALQLLPARPLAEGYLTLRVPLLIPVNAVQATLTFWQDGVGYGGGGVMTLQVSTNGGNSWSDLQWWPGTGSWRGERFDLGSYRGQSVLIRFYIHSFPDPAMYAWRIDEVIITAPVGGCATVTPTLTPTQTATPHPGRFEDVPPSHTFYEYIECLAGRNLVSGYPCGGLGEPCGAGNKPYYRPGNPVTRGQAAKLVVSAAGWTDALPGDQQTFEDVLPGSTFWAWVERLASRGLIGGYPCGTDPTEPCVAPANRPYFRPNISLTRGQLAKIDANAAGYTETPTSQTFADIAPGSTFYLYVERVAARGIVGGYPCGGAGEPCLPPTNRPYYRPGNTVTRGQAAKIVSSTFFPGCQDPPTATATPTLTVTPTATGTPTFFPTETETPAPTGTPTTL